MLKKENVKNGDVIYFVDYFHPSPVNMSQIVQFGIATDTFSDGIDLDFYSPYHKCYVRVEWDNFKSATPIEDYVDDGRWHKLPKGWTYNTQLYKLEWEPIDNVKNLKLNDKDGIIKAIENGFLIKNEKNPKYALDSVVTKDGYKVVKNIDSDHRLWQNHWSDTIRYDKAYATYEEAEAELDAYKAELKRQASLTDEEWSIEQINKEFDRYIGFHKDRKDVAERARAYVLALPHIEDVEVRLFADTIQYKYWKNKKWISISGELV